VWFSDNELMEIKGLVLKDNNISSLAGIERFEKLALLNLSNNKISELPDQDYSLKKIFRIYLAEILLKQKFPMIKENSILILDLIYQALRKSYQSQIL